MTNDNDEFEFAQLQTEAGNFKIIAKRSELDALINGSKVPPWTKYSLVPDTEGEPTHFVQLPSSRIVFVVRELPQEAD